MILSNRCLRLGRVALGASVLTCALNPVPLNAQQADERFYRWARTQAIPIGTLETTDDVADVHRIASVIAVPESWPWVSQPISLTSR
jgi:hypothetical protein